ncbi:MAG TPA: adenine deaminase [Bacteroidales bacterium]|nr:adenine deaminase [Bacteroidales bacterium]
MKIKGRLVDIHNRNIFPAEITVEGERILNIERCENVSEQFIIPGFVDSHVHIESSMVIPASFAEMAVRHGTIGVVSDPHEIANVLGIKGVDYMIENAEKCPVYFWFGAPSCVPATDYETSGGRINYEGVKKLLERKNINFLSEMMNFPGVIHNDREIMEKISAAKELKKPVDGHAPGLSGEDLVKYVNAGITTDHECSSLEEAREKIALGMKILIREGSAARNLKALKELFKSDPEKLMLCSDDIHPEMLEKRHMNFLVALLIREGYDLFDVLRSCTVNPVIHYGLEAGLLRRGDNADFIVVKDLQNIEISETWIKGVKVYGNDIVNFIPVRGENINNFNAGIINEDQIRIKRLGSRIRVIVASDGELLTTSMDAEIPDTEYVVQDVERDILKIVVKDRYNDAPPAVAFISGFGLKNGAFASSVAHDSHNIICVGADDISICKCVNEVIRLKGGLAVSASGRIDSLPLPVAGIMSDDSVMNVARGYEKLSGKVKTLGCSLAAPFMTLSFMALLVIPELKISDRGLFDGRSFSLTNLFAD